MKHWLRKTKGWKAFLLVMLALGVLGAPVAYFGGKYLLRQRALGWRNQGIAASVAGDHERAAELLVRYLRRNPRDVEALAHYIKSRELVELPNGEHLAETVGALKLILGVEPDRVDDRRHLLELYAKLGRGPEALDAANAILSKHPKDLRTLELRTEVLTRARQYREAYDTAERWVAEAPKDYKAHMARLSLRSELKHPAEAIVADATKLREAHPGDPAFELVQGYAFALTGDDAQAIQWFKTAAGHKGLKDDFVKVLVAQFDGVGMSEDSLTVLQELVKGGAGADVRHILARRQWERGRWEQAAEMLADVDPAAAKSDATLVAFRAIALANLGKKAESDACRAALAGRKQAAAKAWALLLPRIIDAAAADDREVAKACREALALEPQNPYLDHYLADAYARLGEMDLAIDAWRRSAEANPTWNVPATRLVEALLRKGRPEQALWVASTAARRSPTNAGTVITLARAWAAGIETGGTAQAEELLQLVTEVQKQLPGEDQTQVIRVQLLARQQKKDEAIAATRSALARTPALDEQAFLAIAAASRKYALGIEEECFAACEKAHGITPGVAYGRAVDQLVAGKADAGLSLFDGLAAKAGKAGEKPWRLARAQYLDVAGHARAREAWIAVADAFPAELAVQQAASSARCVRGDWDFLTRVIERMKAATGDKGLAWRLAEARLMVESPRSNADYEQGSVRLTEIIKEYPGLPEARVLLARALVQMKRVDGAIEHLSKAAELDPTNVPIALQLAALLQSRGDFERVRQELDRVTPQLRTAAQRRQAAAVLADAGDATGALQLLDTKPAQGTAAGEDEPDLFKAILYRRQGQFEKAEAILVRLLEGKADLTTVRFAAALYAAQGRKADGEKVLARLDSMKLEPGIRELVWGGYRLQTGEPAEAVKQYRAAVKAMPTNAVAWRILASAQVATGQAKDAMATLQEAARTLPNDAGLAAIQKHAALLGEAAGDPGLRSEVLLVLGRPLESAVAIELIQVVVEGHRTAEMERLASRLQQLAERNPTFLPIQMQLIQANWSMGRRTDAIAAARRAMTAFPTNPEPARVAVQLLGATGRWAEMRDAAQAWRKRLENPLSADLALARAELGLGQSTNAIAHLQPHVAGAVADPDASADVLTLNAIAVANAGDSKAGVILWPLAQQSRDWRMRWLQVGLSISDGARAEAWIDRVTTLASADAIDEQVAVAEAYDSVAQRTPRSETATRKAAERFKVIAADPRATGIALLASAGHAERAGDLQTAEVLYRRALTLDGKLWIAQNNLAMLVLRRGGDRSEVVALAQAAATNQPRIATLHDTLAQAYAATSKPADAARSMRNAVALEPDNPKWHVRLAKHLLDGGDLAGASKAMGEMDSRRLAGSDLTPELREQLGSIRKRIKADGGYKG